MLDLEDVARMTLSSFWRTTAASVLALSLLAVLSLGGMIFLDFLCFATVNPSSSVLVSASPTMPQVASSWSAISALMLIASSTVPAPLGNSEKEERRGNINFYMMCKTII